MKEFNRIYTDIEADCTFSNQEISNLCHQVYKFIQENNIDNEPILCGVENGFASFVLIATVLYSDLELILDKASGESTLLSKQTEITIGSEKLKLNKELANSFYFDNFFVSERSEGTITVFSSGSTGIPKAIRHHCSTILSCAKVFSDYHGIKDSSFLHVLPMSYMAGILNSIAVPLVSNSSLLIAPEFGVGNVMKFHEYPRVKHYWLTPTMIALLSKFGKKGSYDKYDTAIGFCCTAPLSPTVKKDFEKSRNICVLDTYGLSEILFVSSETKERKSYEGYVGNPLPTVELQTEKDGELVVSSSWACIGFRPYEKFYTGDLAEIDESGLKIIGRKKDIIIRGGKNYSPIALENNLMEIIGTTNLVVVGQRDKYLGEKIVCFYGTDPKRDPRTINKSELLKKDVVIDEWFELAEIPRLSNGKVDRVRMNDQYDELVQ